MMVQGDDSADKIKKWATLFVAAVLLIIYLVLVLVTMGKTGVAAEPWSRRLVLLGGIESLAFAGAGWLFGKEVSRQTIDQANARLVDANQKVAEAGADLKQASDNARTAIGNAVALAQTVKLIAPRLEQQADLFGVPASQPQDLADAVLAKYGVGS
jgi:hypothetical protein